MAKQFHGSFIFTRQGYGILSGVYNNNIAPEPFPETAKKKRESTEANESDDLFEGTYKTIWLEDDDNPTTDLEIIRQTDGTFKLKWFDTQKNWYHGVGFIHDNKFVGTYWK